MVEYISNLKLLLDMKKIIILFLLLSTISSQYPFTKKKFFPSKKLPASVSIASTFNSNINLVSSYTEKRFVSSKKPFVNVSISSTFNSYINLESSYFFMGKHDFRNLYTSRIEQSYSSTNNLQSISDVKKLSLSNKIKFEIRNKNEPLTKTSILTSRIIQPNLLQINKIKANIQRNRPPSRNKNDNKYVHCHTNLGLFQGLKIAHQNVELGVYLGIPYAHPPTGNKRFKPPVALNTNPEQSSDYYLPKPYNATVLPNSCYQLINNEYDYLKGGDLFEAKTPLSEDCLYLNIWVPLEKQRNIERSSKAVMVFIHGGGFTGGSSTLDLYNGKMLAATENVIVVNINYRIGILGFLFADDNLAPGNVGLLDQQLALQWVFDNIYSFGGDNNHITIFGHSAGAASVGFHLLSSNSRKLFKSAILMSGSPFSEWSYVTKMEAKKRTRKLAILFGCSSEDKRNKLNYEIDTSVVNCLLTIPAQNLTNSQMTVLPENLFSRTPFVPVLSKSFFQTNKTRIEDILLNMNDLKKKVIITSWTKNEGSFLVAPYLVYKNLTKDIRSVPDLNNSVFIEISNEILERFDGKIREEIISFYKNKGSKNNLDTLIELSGDILFKCPILRFQNFLFNKGVKQYSYQFLKELTKYRIWPEWMGVEHGADLPFVFGIPILSYNFSNTDRKISRDMMNYFSNFAKNGNFDAIAKHSWIESKTYIFGAGDVKQQLDNRSMPCQFIEDILLKNTKH